MPATKQHNQHTGQTRLPWLRRPSDSAPILPGFTAGWPSGVALTPLSIPYGLPALGLSASHLPAAKLESPQLSLGLL